MKCEIHGIKDLKTTSFRAYCLLLDDKHYLDAADMCNDTNFGAMINDCFNSEGYNVYGEGLKMEDGTWVPIFQIFSLRALKSNEELFLEYGKKYWCYRGNFDRLSPAQQLKCRAHYQISDEDFVNAVKEPKSTRKKKGKAAASTTKKVVEVVTKKRKAK